MAVYKRKYRDRKTGELKDAKVWSYKFVFDGQVIKGSPKTRVKAIAKAAEAKRRRELKAGSNGLDRLPRLVSQDDLSRLTSGIGRWCEGRSQEESENYEAYKAFCRDHFLMHWAPETFASIMRKRRNKLARERGDS
jgi:hypothetical protein